MSRLEELIAELCPDGVEYLEIDDAFELKNGYTPSKRNDKYWNNGTIPWFTLNDIRTNGRILYDAIQHVTEEGVKGGKLVPKGSIIMSTTATIGEHALINVDALTNQQITSYTLKSSYSNKLDIKFAFYYFFNYGEWCRKEANQSGGMAIISLDKLKKFRIPVPPLPVQQEIVRILDKFTALETELEAELEARKKQYEYYRDELLTFGDDVERFKIGDFFNMKAGKSIIAEDISGFQTDEYPFPCYGGNGLRGYAKKPSHKGKYIIIGRQGALCGNVKRVDGEFYATEHAVVVEAMEGVDIDWAFHVLSFMNLNQYATKSAQPGLSVGRIQTLEIPIPPVDEQKRIATILDRFDALVNDITQGLPAEIAARRKQYEYYRNNLLTFKEKVS